MGAERPVGARRILVAGMGNVLRQDDGFGVEVARRLQAEADLPAGARVVEVGIGGISLVQELMAPPGYDVLLVVDAADRNGDPGQVYVLEAEVTDLDALPEAVRRDFLADMHYTTPTRALMLAKALRVLPAQTLIVGCQPTDTDEFAIGLSPPVSAAVGTAVDQVKALLQALVEEAPA